MATAPPLPFSSSTSAASLVSLAGDALLPFFTATEARTLRLLSRELRAAVAAFPWADTATVIRGDLARWRACFPRARVANVSGRRDLSDADFAHLAGLHTLDMSWCRSPRLTDAALALAGPGLRVLNMRHCKQPSITGAAFAHLRSLHTLHMDGCTQLGDAALARLVAPGDGSGGSLRVLTMRSVKGVTDAGLQPLRALHTLDMQGCSQEGITDAAFAPLRATLVRLNISECRQATLTDGALAGLCCLRELQASRCAQLTSAAFAHLRLRVLDVSFNRQPELGDAAFAALRGCAERLDMTGCSQATITDAAFANLQGIQELDVSGCRLGRRALGGALPAPLSCSLLSHARNARARARSGGGPPPASLTPPLRTCAASTRWKRATATRPASQTPPLRTCAACAGCSCGAAASPASLTPPLRTWQAAAWRS